MLKIKLTVKNSDSDAVFVLFAIMLFLFIMGAISIIEIMKEPTIGDEARIKEETHRVQISADSNLKNDPLTLNTKTYSPNNTGTIRSQQN